MPTPPSATLRAAVLAVPLIPLIAIIAWQAFRAGPDSGPVEPPVPELIPLPPSAPCEYLNATPDTAYVGTAACIECHKGNHQSYSLTPHSKALAELDPGAEPPDAVFAHIASGRTYRVYREDGRLRHEETIRDPQGRVVARADYPVRYVIGSGHFCRSYIIDVEGFLHESPITWYSGRGAYDMSPGYDAAHHSSFERPITQGCLKCHSGGASAEGTVHKLKIREHAVGCESCHGPGSKHVEVHRTKKAAAGETDLTIVNPGKLSRPLAEAVCGECHLGSAATVRLRGRGPDDFRPGMPLSNQRVDYRAAESDGRMTVTGHFEQLRQSKCYTNPNLTCITCHDPHARQKPVDVAAHHRQQCLSCHAPEKCKSPAADRAKTTPADNCAACHMPRGDTEIPHLAFSHHRIGIHGPKPPAPTTAPVLEPMADESHLSLPDRKRNLALAYLAAAEKQGYEKFAAEFEARALPLLEEAYALGLRDPETAQWLARLTMARNPRQAIEYARLVVEAKDAHPEMRAYALMMLANGDFMDRKYAGAIGKLNELVRLRRLSDDWRFLGDCHLVSGDNRASLDAFGKAIEIRPFRPKNHAGMAETYRRLGNPAKFTEHQSTAEYLQLARQE